MTCNCYNKSPTAPTFRDQFTHLPDCPCFGQHAMPVGVVTGVVSKPITVRATAEACGYDVGNGHKCCAPKGHTLGMHEYSMDFL